MNIGERLKLMRKQKKLSRKKLADKLDISEQVIYNIETNRTKIISLRNYELDKLCFYLSCTKDFLLGLSDDSTKDRNGITPQIILNSHTDNFETLKRYSEEFPEGFSLLCTLTEKLSSKERKFLLKMLESFLIEE